MKHYVGVFVHATTGRWRALVPDLPSYEVEEGTLDRAIVHAEEFLRQVIRLGTPVPPPRPLALLRHIAGRTAYRGGTSGCGDSPGAKGQTLASAPRK